VAVSSQLKIILTWYNLNNRQLAGEEIINALTEQDILDLFDAPFWNHAYLCIALENKKHFDTIQKNTSHSLQRKKYSYFLEMFKIDAQSIDCLHS